MNCTAGTCQCGAYQYFNEPTLNCKAQTTNNTACTANNTCRVDKGLTCQNGTCQCDLRYQFWYRSLNNCIDIMTYNGQGCEINTNCRSSENLICSLTASSNQCNCNQTSVNQMCDCKRVFGDEYFWNGSFCKQAYSYSHECHRTYQCQT